MVNFLSNSPFETKKLGEILGKEALSSRTPPSLRESEANSDSPQLLVERLDQIGIKNKRRPSLFEKKGCPKGDSARAKRVPIWKTKKTKRSVLKESKHPAGQALVLGLEGDLGGGKTTFLQGFAKGLGIKQRITSPTFIILKKFKIPRKSGIPPDARNNLNFKVFYHIDCYRIEKPKDLLQLGFKKIVSNPENIIAIEWAGRIRKILPKDALIIKFKFVSKNKRKIKISP